MNKLTLIVLSAILFSCTDNTAKTEDATVKPNLDKMSWVLGSWYMNTPDGTISEEWEKVNDSLYSGFSIMVTPKGDTVFIEDIKLTGNAEGLCYMPTVSNQNKGEEVRFKEKTATGDEIVFENPAHDFPQRIIYRKLSDSTIVASIEGEQNGKMRKEEFSYKRK
jgi:hypothetical protein